MPEGGRTRGRRTSPAGADCGQASGDRRRVLHLPRHLAFGLGQQGLLVFLVIAPQDEADDDRQRQHGPADWSGNAAYALAEQVTPVPNIVAQVIPPAALKMKKRQGASPFAPASSAAKARSSATKRPKNTINPP
jgi:hypothetical protein